MHVGMGCNAQIGRQGALTYHRLARFDVDGAGGSVAAVQNALRALQQLDPVEIEELHQSAHRAADEHAVVSEADSGIDVRLEGEIPNATNEYEVTRRRRLHGQGGKLLV